MKNGLQSSMLSAHTRKANQAEICKQLSFLFLFDKFLTTHTYVFMYIYIYVYIKLKRYDAINEKTNRWSVFENNTNIQEEKKVNNWMNFRDDVYLAWK